MKCWFFGAHCLSNTADPLHGCNHLGSVFSAFSPHSYAFPFFHPKGLSRQLSSWNISSAVIYSIFSLFKILFF